MKFKEGTSVKTVGGNKVGSIDHIVVDPTTNEVTHIVVRKGFIFTEDRVVPVSSLRGADDNTVILDWDVENLDQFPNYKDSYYVSPDGEYSDEMPPQWGDWGGAPLFYYPPVGMEPNYQSGVGYAGAAVGTVPDGEGVKREVRNVPDESVSISKGTTVTTSDGEHAGHVEQAFTDSNGTVTHILVSKGVIFAKERLIPIRWVRRMNDSEIRLSVREEIVKDLPEYKAN
jgi:uncharacterized protein YrrD